MFELDIYKTFGVWYIYENEQTFLEKGALHMNRNQSIQQILAMLMSASDQQLQRLQAFIEAYLRPGA